MKQDADSRPPRDDAILATAENALATAAVGLIASHNKVALSYSGGAESGLLLHLLRPFRRHFMVLWVNPGVLPHDAEHVRRQASDGPFVEVPSDREASWKERGLPAPVVVGELLKDLQGDVPAARPFQLPHALCCINVRNLPGDQWLAANGFDLMIHGQRRGEGSGLFNTGPRLFTRWAPLANWTRAEVMARVARHGVPLPMQYAEGYPESAECAVCPANLRAERLAFLRRHYPAEHAETLRLARQVHDDTLLAITAHHMALTEAEGSAAAEPEKAE